MPRKKEESDPSTNLVKEAVSAVSATHKLMIGKGASSASAGEACDKTFTELAKVAPVGSPCRGLDQQQANQLRKLYMAGAKTAAAAEKQLSEGIRAIKSLSASITAAETLAARDVVATSNGGSGETAEAAATIAAKKRKRQEEKGIKFKPSMVNRTPEHGEPVASKVASHDLWILVTVDKLDPTTHKVVVVDEHVDQDGPPSTANELRGRRYFVNREHVLLMPLPQDAPNIKHEIGSKVMAMYPDTTTFYPAKVTESGIMEGERCCTVQFVDDEDETGVIPSRLVPNRFITVR